VQNQPTEVAGQPGWLSGLDNTLSFDRYVIAIAICRK